MNQFLKDRRSSGILAHITSLPAAFGIGDIGCSAERFLRFLDQAGQRYWQILPIGPTSLHFDSSPYMSTSAFAGSPLLICPNHLKKMGFIDTIKEQPQAFSPYTTNFSAVTAYKTQLLQAAFENFTPHRDSRFEQFVVTSQWLEDYATFMTLKKIYHQRAWYDWPAKYRHREAKALAHLTEQHAEIFTYYLFEQFIFFLQWRHLKQRAAEHQIGLIGDIPIYVSLDSVDVWAHQDIFELDPQTSQPLRVSGVPPDYFSTTGQRWGNPLYRWNDTSSTVQKNLLNWWEKRFREAFRLVDAARIDHFRGFESYWAVPNDCQNGAEGSWLTGPGADFFHHMEQRAGPLKIIAEDLGEITPAVIKLREALGLPGMKVLQFAFDGDPTNAFLPYNFKTDHCVVYTGTHDNNTTVGWFLSEVRNDQLRSSIKSICNGSLHDQRAIHEDFLYLAMTSIANLAITPLQDLLGFGEDCRMNRPGVPTGNWRWRCAPDYLSDACAAKLRTLTIHSGRLTSIVEDRNATR